MTAHLLAIQSPSKALCGVIPHMNPPNTNIKPMLVNKTQFIRQPVSAKQNIKSIILSRTTYIRQSLCIVSQAGGEHIVTFADQSIFEGRQSYAAPEPPKQNQNFVWGNPTSKTLSQSYLAEQPIRQPQCTLSAKQEVKALFWHLAVFGFVWSPSAVRVSCRVSCRVFGFLCAGWILFVHSSK
jgi:hypothetical protein